MIFNSSINPVQRQYTTAINPVHLFEASSSNASNQRTFGFNNQMFQKSNSSGYNPFHPNVQTSTLAKNLDIMS